MTLVISEHDRSYHLMSNNEKIPGVKEYIKIGTIMSQVDNQILSQSKYDENKSSLFVSLIIF